MELQMQETKYKTKKHEVDRLSKILEEVVQLSKSESKMSPEEALKLVNHYKDQISEFD